MRSQVKEKIQSYADEQSTEGFDIRFGHGQINVFKSLSSASRQLTFQSVHRMR